MSVTLVHPTGPWFRSLVAPPPYGYLLSGATIAPPRGHPSSGACRTRADGAHAGRTLSSSKKPAAARVGGRANWLSRRDRPARPPPRFPPPSPRAATIRRHRADRNRHAGLALGQSVPRPAYMQRARCSMGRRRTSRSCRRGTVPRPSPTSRSDARSPTCSTTGQQRSADGAGAVRQAAPWFETNTGLQNSTVLESLGDDDFAFVKPRSVGLRRALRRRGTSPSPSFHRFVRPTLDANNIPGVPGPSTGSSERDHPRADSSENLWRNFTRSDRVGLRTLALG